MAGNPHRAVPAGARCRIELARALVSANTARRRREGGAAMFRLAAKGCDPRQKGRVVPGLPLADRSPHSIVSDGSSPTLVLDCNPDRVAAAT